MKACAAAPAGFMPPFWSVDSRVRNSAAAVVDEAQAQRAARTGAAAQPQEAEP